MTHEFRNPRAKNDGILVLEDGRSFRGRRFGAITDALGEVVFNTSMTGYQEILTDPSYAGQIVVMTYPQIGNYGVNPEDTESRELFLSALVVREASRIVSNWRGKQSLTEYLRANNVPGLEGFDTRALVRHIRTHGAMRGIIASGAIPTDQLLSQVKRHPTMARRDLASEVTRNEQYGWAEAPVVLPSTPARVQPPNPFANRLKVAVYDFGAKWNILRCLVEVGCDVTVVPASMSAADLMSLKVDGVVLSNGPGDPDPVQYAVESIRQLIGRVPIFGICLGHQLLGIAAGGKTYKLKFGHRGGNHPVIDLTTRRVEITSHNHGFAVDPDSLPDSRVEVTHINLNDQTCEGLRLKDCPAFSVQYHPEAAPGPHDALHMFERFAGEMRQWKEHK
jgi:carbamoyl-phosphate synthase small subunit